MNKLIERPEKVFIVAFFLSRVSPLTSPSSPGPLAIESVLHHLIEPPKESEKGQKGHESSPTKAKKDLCQTEAEGEKNEREEKEQKKEENDGKTTNKKIKENTKTNLHFPVRENAMNSRIRATERLQFKCSD